MPKFELGGGGKTQFDPSKVAGNSKQHDISGFDPGQPIGSSGLSESLPQVDTSKATLPRPSFTASIQDARLPGAGAGTGTKSKTPGGGAPQTPGGGGYVAPGAQTQPSGGGYAPPGGQTHPGGGSYPTGGGGQQTAPEQAAELEEPPEGRPPAQDPGTDQVDRGADDEPSEGDGGSSAAPLLIAGVVLVGGILAAVLLSGKGKR